MKKIVSLILVLLIMICIVGNVYAATSCSINLQTAKSEYSNGDEVTVDVNVADIKGDRGIISFGATLDYDKSILTYVKMEGKNGWDTPSYNENSGILVSTRNNLGKDNETVFTVTFKVKDASKKTTAVTLKDVTVGDGGDSGATKVSSATKNINIKSVNSDENQTVPGDNIVNPPNTNNSVSNKVNNSTSNNVSSNRNKINSSASQTGRLPKAGATSITLIVCIVVVVAIAVFFYIKVRILNKKSDE